MIIRKTMEKDLPAISEIYDAAKEFMKAAGNPTQWQGNGAPGIETARKDMESGVGYVCVDSDEIVAVFMFAIGNDKIYDKIYDGEWKNWNEYAVIHRIAVKHHGRGIIDFCFAECFKMFPNIKIDTHRDNLPMQKVLSRAGFERCGIIYLENGDERIAFQKTK